MDYENFIICLLFPWTHPTPKLPSRSRSRNPLRRTFANVTILGGKFLLETGIARFRPFLWNEQEPHDAGRLTIRDFEISVVARILSHAQDNQNAGQPDAYGDHGATTVAV